MSLTDFDKAIIFTLGWEGGYVNDPDDPGGETNFGISKRAHPNLDIPNLLREEAIGIYHAEYWMSAGCPLWNWPENLVLFDTAVNLGVAKACYFLGMSEDWRDILLHRIKHHVARKNPKYIQGWLNRCMALWDYAIK